MSLPDAIKYFESLVQKELGITPSSLHLEARLREVSSLLGMKSVEELHSRCATFAEARLISSVLDAVTNKETSFFRDFKVFQAIEKDVLPSLVAEAAKLRRPLRIWSAACSFGQEPYTLAIVLTELRNAGFSFPVEIIATDVSSLALQRATAGVYSHLEVQRGLPAPLLLKYFSSKEKEWGLRSDIKAMVTFRKLNLLDDFTSMGTFDLLLCRNVLIYQTPENKASILKRLYSRLNPHGFLLLGAAETMIGLSQDFEMFRFGQIVAYRRKSELPIPVTVAA